MPTATVSKNFRTFLLGKYPALIGNTPYVRFMHYLCFGTFRDKESHHLVIPTRVMAERFFQVSPDDFNGREALEKFRSEVLPGLAWSEHQFTNGRGWGSKAREIIHLGFDEEMQEALRQECLNPSEDQVDIVTGHAFRREDRYRITADESRTYEADLAACAVNATQRKLLDYLRGINAGHLFLRKIGENRQAIETAVEQLDPELQATRYRILKVVQENPNVYYLPSARGNTCRLSAQGDSILGLKKEVRQACTQGWVECDLRSSQFAILAAKLNAPTAQAFIASGKSIWREFYHHVSGLDAVPPSETKAVFKEAMYALCFGKTETNLRTFLRQHDMAHLLKHPILRELLQLRREWFRQIEAAGGALDAWGVWQAVDSKVDPETGKDRWAGSVAATVIQSIEMEIIAPIFDTAILHGKSDQFRICLFQHDGATLSFHAPEKQARAQAKLKEAVESRAKRLGVCTVLEFTQL